MTKNSQNFQRGKSPVTVVDVDEVISSLDGSLSTSASFLSTDKLRRIARLSSCATSEAHEDVGIILRAYRPVFAVGMARVAFRVMRNVSHVHFRLAFVECHLRPFLFALFSAFGMAYVPLSSSKIVPCTRCTSCLAISLMQAVVIIL